MTSVTLPNTGLTAGYVPGENGWSGEMNRNLRLLDAVVQPRVVDKDVTAPPGATAGDVYIVGAGATGDWAGHDGALAVWQVGDDLTSAWTFITPHESWRVWLIDETCFYQYISSVWVKDETSEVTASRYSVPFGDGSSANFFINHALGTRDVHVTVYRNATPWDDIICDVSRPTVDQIELSGFSGAPSTDEFVVHVSK